MPSIKQELFRGVFWSAVQKYSGFVISVIVSMILARILSPEDYGVVAIATVIIVFLRMFGSMGMGPAVIQKDLTPSELNSIFTFSVVMGLFLASLFFCSSWGIAAFYGNSLLVPICQILSIQLFFSAINMVPNALMSKDKRFKEIAKRTLCLRIATGVLSVMAAFKGFGVYALLISPILSSISIFFWNRMFYPVKIDWKFDIKPLKKIFSFSSYQFLFNFVNYFSRNLDKLIIGRMIGMNALGVYEKAYRLMHLPLQYVTFVITPVLQPVLRDLKEDKADLSMKYAKIIRFVSTISFPAGIILAGMSKEIIHIFYGGKWDAAIPIFSILALSLPLQMILSTSGSIYMVCDNTKMQFWLGIRNTVTTVAGFIIAAYFWGTLEAMAWAWTITLVLNFIFTYGLMYRYVLKQSIRPFLNELIRPTILFVSLAILMYFLNSIDWNISLLGVTFIKGGVSLIMTLVLIQILGQYNMIKIIKYILSKTR